MGLVPAPAVEAVSALNGKILQNGQHLDRMVWPKKPRDVQDLLRMSVSDAHSVTKAATDLRALVTAYAHQFHQPRLVMADLARARQASPQGITRRYSEANVVALENLLSQDPDIPDIPKILKGFPSLSMDDLRHFSGPVAVAARQDWVLKAGEWQLRAAEGS